MAEKIIYNKLVRDKIPEIIEASGKTCETGILSDEEYLQILNRRTRQRTSGYAQSKTRYQCRRDFDIVRKLKKF